MLDGTWTSAALTHALAPISSVPTARQERSWPRVGRSTLVPRRTARNASIAAPAKPKRAPALRNGGIVSTVTRMAREVEPPTRETIQRAGQTCQSGAAAGAPSAGAPAGREVGEVVVVVLTERRSGRRCEHQSDGCLA